MRRARVIEAGRAAAVLAAILLVLAALASVVPSLAWFLGFVVFAAVVVGRLADRG